MDENRSEHQGHAMNFKHGTSRILGSTTYSSWRCMKARCFNKNNISFRNYGARGISVCERWLTFSNFLADMGHRPPGLFLERKDNSGNYEPGNCKWATRSEQRSNTRINRIIEFGGLSMTQTAWAKKAGIALSSLKRRIEAGWPLEKALTLKPDSSRRVMEKS